MGTERGRRRGIKEHNYGVSGEVGGVPAEPRRAGDGCQRPLRSRFQPRLTPSVGRPFRESPTDRATSTRQLASDDVRGERDGKRKGAMVRRHDDHGRHPQDRALPECCDHQTWGFPTEPLVWLGQPQAERGAPPRSAHGSPARASTASWAPWRGAVHEPCGGAYNLETERLGWGGNGGPKWNASRRAPGSVGMVRNRCRWRRRPTSHCSGRSPALAPLNSSVERAMRTMP